MALAQAHTLNHLFNRLTQRAFTNLGGPRFEPYMHLALRAQSAERADAGDSGRTQKPDDLREAIERRESAGRDEWGATHGSDPIRPRGAAGTASNSSFRQIRNPRARA